MERPRSILAIGEQVQTATRPRRRVPALATRQNAPKPCGAQEFAAGSLEAELSAIGKAVPAREWAKVPADYFANLDFYLHSAPKKK
jgi:hypothetical protein